MLVEFEKLQGRNKLIESCITVLIGVFMHLNRISIIELKYSRLPLLTPNIASCLFVFSVLCILSRLRPLWPSALRKPQRALIFLVELSLILYATDFLLRQVWLPSLKLLNFLCRFLGQYVVVANEAFLANNAPTLSSWIRNDVFYLARFLLAVITFVFMIDITGMLEFVLNIFRPFDSNMEEGSFQSTPTDTLDRMDEYNYEDPKMDDILLPVPDNNRFSNRLSDLESTSFDVNDLPFVPQEDLLNLGHRVGGRRRRQPMRKAKRGKFVLNEAEDECTC